MIGGVDRLVAGARFGSRSMGVFCFNDKDLRAIGVREPR
jgi:hypothetical protein